MVERKTRLVLIRHAATTVGEHGRIVGGRTNVPLCFVGYEQAAELPERLGNRRYDLVIASDLDRASDTGHPVARTSRTRLRRTRLLRERDYGGIELLTDADEIAEARQRLGDYWLSGRRHHRRVVRDMESDHEMLGRVWKVIEMIKDHYRGQTVAAVAHADVISTAFRAIEPTEGHALLVPENTGFVVVDLTSKVPRAVTASGFHKFT